MILFKKIDLLIQALCTFFCVWIAVKGSDLGFLFYPLVGGWQVISTSVHAGFRSHYYVHKHRRLYHWFLFLAVLLLATLLLGSIIAGFIMLIAGPIMAAWYFYICCREFSLLTFKKAVHLKR